MTIGHQQKKQLNGQQNGSAGLLLSVTCLLWLAAKLIGWKLWVTARLFPVVPPFIFLQKIPAEVHWILLFAAVIFLLVLIFKPGLRLLQYSLLLVEILSCLLDQNRWQPWEYLYLFLLIIFIINCKADAVITCFSIALPVIYFYSGLHKMNSAFVADIWDHTILRRFFHVAPVKNSWLHFAGYTLPVIECLAAVGLLFNRTRKHGASVLILMHVFILLLIGPMGINYNQVVWPWNIAMIFYCWFIFINSHRILPVRYKLIEWKSKLILMLWIVLPAFNFIGLWDNYLSWNLYSSALPGMVICVKDSVISSPLQPFISKKNITKICDGSIQINIQSWALKEMNVPAYPELRVFKQIEDTLRARYTLVNASAIIQR